MNLIQHSFLPPLPLPLPCGLFLLPLKKPLVVGWNVKLLLQSKSWGLLTTTTLTETELFNYYTLQLLVIITPLECEVLSFVPYLSLRIAEYSGTTNVYLEEGLSNSTCYWNVHKIKENFSLNIHWSGKQNKSRNGTRIFTNRDHLASWYNCN